MVVPQFCVQVYTQAKTERETNMAGIRGIDLDEWLEEEGERPGFVRDRLRRVCGDRNPVPELCTKGDALYLGVSTLKFSPKMGEAGCG